MTSTEDIQSYNEYVYDHQDQIINQGNILDEQRHKKYTYQPLGIQMGNRIDEIDQVIAVKHFLRPGDITLAGYKVVAL